MNTEQVLLDYAARFLKITARPDEPIAVTLKQVIGFAKLLRAGCEQDLKRLDREGEK